tara:strand:+ start:717 stop:1646 length:930 start_codon:yes stop_codon:yes gene_type:complete
MKGGLPNLGNTCYINTALQCLFSINAFKSFLVSLQIQELSNVFQSKENYVSFIKYLSQHITLINILDENDIHEFLLLFFHHLHNISSIKKNITKNTSSLITSYEKLNHLSILNWYQDYSILKETFYFQYIQCIDCYNCKNNHINIQESFVLEIPIQNQSIKDGIEDFFQKKLLDSIEWKCDKCNLLHKNNTAQNYLWKLPNVFIVCIKRFSFNKNRIIKDFSEIKIDITINLNQFYINKKNNINYTYELKSIANHHGNSYYGHYTADILDNISDLKIIKFDDLNKTLIKNLDKCNSYILFYEKYGRTSK